MIESHAEAARRELERADYVRNADNWPGESRGEDAAYHVAAAQVHATLNLADAVTEAAGRG